MLAYLILRNEAFQFVNCDMAPNMPADHKYVLVVLNSFNIQACDTIRLYWLVDQSFDFLFTVIKKSYWAIRATNRNKVF